MLLPAPMRRNLLLSILGPLASVVVFLPLAEAARTRNFNHSSSGAVVHGSTFDPEKSGLNSSVPGALAAANWLAITNATFPSEVYVTAMTNGDFFLPGLKALAASLLDSGTTRPLVVMLDSEPSPALKKISKCLKLRLVVMPEIKNPYHGGWWKMLMAHVFNKLNVFRLPAKRVVFLDADAVVLKNIDELFSVDGDLVFRAAPDCGGKGIQCGGKDQKHFNSGVMVVNPSNDTFNDMMNKVGSIPSYDETDQGFLNSYFEKMWHVKESHAQLPTKYNTLKRQEDVDGFDLGQVSVIHNVGDKPWDPQATAENKSYPKSHGAWATAEASYKRRCEK